VNTYSYNDTMKVYAKDGILYIESEGQQILCTDYTCVTVPTYTDAKDLVDQIYTYIYNGNNPAEPYVPTVSNALDPTLLATLTLVGLAKEQNMLLRINNKYLRNILGDEIIESDIEQ